MPQRSAAEFWIVRLRDACADDDVGGRARQHADAFECRHVALRSVLLRNISSHYAGEYAKIFAKTVRASSHSVRFTKTSCWRHAIAKDIG